ncbi:hypothetical protein ACWGLE_28485 [Streptomyces sp. NPDC055897]
MLRTTDLGEALTLAEKLLSVACRFTPSSCYLSAWAWDDVVLRRLTEALPGARVEWYSKDRAGFPASVLSPGVTTVAQACEALRVWAEITRCYVLWHDVMWPPVPELGLDHDYKYAELQVVSNSHTIQCEEWAAEHTVFIHTRPGQDERAAWLAAQVGAGVVGPSEEGW